MNSDGGGRSVNVVPVPVRRNNHRFFYRAIGSFLTEFLERRLNMRSPSEEENIPSPSIWILGQQ
jgi:hypothetical protein